VISVVDYAEPEALYTAFGVLRYSVPDIATV